MNADGDYAVGVIIVVVIISVIVIIVVVVIIPVVVVASGVHISIRTTAARLGEGPSLLARSVEEQREAAFAEWSEVIGVSTGEVSQGGAIPRSTEIVDEADSHRIVTVGIHLPHRSNGEMGTDTVGRILAGCRRGDLNSRSRVRNRFGIIWSHSFRQCRSPTPLNPVC